MDVSQTQEFAGTLDVFNGTKQFVLFFVPIIPGLLSFIGSSCIIYRIMKRENKWNIFHRMMLMMSIIDIPVSINFSLSTIPSNSDIPIQVWVSYGNEETCSASGFVFNLINSIAFYNAFILLYITAHIRYNVSDQSIPRCFELCIHLLSVFYPFGFGLYATIMGYMNPWPAMTRCYLSRYPPFCELYTNIECTRGPPPEWLYWVMYLGPQYVGFVLFVVCAIIIRSKVRNTEHNLTTANHNEMIVSNYTHEVTIQSLLYAFTFSNTFIWTIIPHTLIDRIQSNPADYIGKIFPFLVIGRIFLPLEGFTNMLIYFGPRFRRIQKLRSGKSIAWLCKETITGPPFANGVYTRSPVLSTSFYFSRQDLDESNIHGQLEIQSASDVNSTSVHGPYSKKQDNHGDNNSITILNENTTDSNPSVTVDNEENVGSD